MKYRIIEEPNSFGGSPHFWPQQKTLFGWKPVEHGESGVWICKSLEEAKSAIDRYIAKDAEPFLFHKATKVHNYP